jgi:acyl-coenzyme A thioesterase PaaI-like protein
MGIPDFDQLRIRIKREVPFIRYLDLEYVHLAPGEAEVLLPDRPELRTHLGTQHAGALFTVADAAAGAAFITTFTDVVDDLVPVTKHGEIAFLRPAHGPVTAKARFRDHEAMLEDLRANGEAEFSTLVEVCDRDGETVASVRVEWHVSARRPLG